MKKLRKIVRQNVVTLPQQSLTAMRVAFGVRAQYATIAMLSLLMITQVIGVVIFSGKAQAVTSPTVTTGEATVISQTQAKLVLQSTDIANAAAATYSFEYGTTTSYGLSALTSAQTWGSPNDNTTVNFSISGGSATVSASGWSGRLRSPQFGGVRDSAGNFYTPAWDDDDPECRIMKFNAAGNFVLQLGGTCAVNSPTLLNRVEGALAVDADDNLYVGQPNSQYILKYAPNGDLLGNIDMGDNAGADSIAVDDLSGSVYVKEEYDRIAKYDSAGNNVTNWDTTPLGARDFGLQTIAIAVNSLGDIYVSCGIDGTVYGNPENALPCGKIWRYDSAGNLLDEWASTTTASIFIDDNDVIYTHDYNVDFPGWPHQEGIFSYDYEGNELSRSIFNGTATRINGISSVNTVTGVLETVTNSTRPSFDSFARKGAASLSSLTCGTTYHYRAKAVSGAGTSYSSDQTFTTLDCDPEVADPVYLEAFYGTAHPNVPFSQYIQTVGDATGHTFSLLGCCSALPPGLTINAATGEIHGTPTTPGIYYFNLKIEDSLGHYVYGNSGNMIQVLPSLSIGDTLLNTAYEESEYIQWLGLQNNYGEAIFSVESGSLPSGLSLSSSGLISGTPAQGTVGNYTFTVAAHDDYNSDTQEFTLEVIDPIDQEAPAADITSEDPPVEEPEQPTITNVIPSPSNAVAPEAAVSSRLRVPQTVVAAQNNVFALAKRLPEPFAIGLPWFLLSLALILVGVQYYQVHSEAASTKRMQASVANQERLIDEQNNFVALSTHYLHTPLTVMEGEISLMVKAGTLTQAEATKLKATLTSLSAEAEATLAQEEQSE